MATPGPRAVQVHFSTIRWNKFRIAASCGWGWQQWGEAVVPLRYAQERSWRGDNRRLSNGEQVNRLAALSLKRGRSVDFGGYWQRHSKDVHA